MDAGKTETGDKKSRRPRGTGGIYKRDDNGLWCAVVELPPSIDGKRRRKYIARKRRPDVVAELSRLKKELAHFGDLSTTIPTFETWCHQWLDTSAKRLKPSTSALYRHTCERFIIPTIGKQPVDRIQPSHVRQVQDFAGADGRTSTTALHAHRILSACLEDAVREQLIATNPAKRTRAPRMAQTTRTALTVEQAKKVLAYAQRDTALSVRVQLALLAGLRRGEALGLTWDAIDLENRTLSVLWALQRIPYQHGCGKQTKNGEWPCGDTKANDCPEKTVELPSEHEGINLYAGLWLIRPKSRAGARQMPLAPQLHESLTKWKEESEPGIGGLVLHRPDGKPINPHLDDVAWHETCKAAAIPEVPLHSARHTTATLLHSLGVSELVIQQMLGHADVSTTNEIYTHITDAEAIAAMNSLDSALAE